MANIPVSLRPASLDDLAQISKIESVSYPIPWTREQFEQELNTKQARFLVLTDDETDEFVVGYIIYWVQAEGVSLLNVAVHPEWRGLGNAQKLMRAMVNETVKDEISKITLEVRASNLGAIRLYQNSGFKKTHERKSFYANGETAFVMELKTSELSAMIQ
jgi:ribosomal-protein-alanine N-acetyltransferase